MQVQARRSQTERREQTQRLLLAAARKLFAAQGYAQTSTPDIVAAAGVTRHVAGLKEGGSGDPWFCRWTRACEVHL